ncbi:MAG: ABC transporter permease [Acidobacteria bacterium]|nr:ABC transporter permease [Acidobacteriota bacterium]
MRVFLEDARYGFRLLRRSPGFAAVAILALALGIGANTAVFSVVHAVLLAPLPYADMDRLVMVYEDSSRMGFPRNNPAPANWVDVRKQNTVFTEVAATRGAAFSITGDGVPEQIFATAATASLWQVLGASPVLGRVFTQTEDEKDEKVVVLSHGLWTRRYGGERSIVGRKILLNSAPYMVIGVMPRAFSFHRRVDAWVPAAFTPEHLARRGSHYLTCVARLKPGVSVQQAQTEMSGIMKRLENEYPNSNSGIGSAVVPLREAISTESKDLLMALLFAAGCVLLIACANIANLLLARSGERHREMALRSAVGAGASRLLQQLLTESLLLALLGAVGGLLLAKLGMRTLETLIPRTMAETRLELDPMMLGFTMMVALLTGLLFGAIPAWTAVRVDLQDALKQGGRGTAGGRHSFLRSGLVVVQVSLALTLLAGAGLMMQTLRNLYQADIGMRTDHLLTMDTFPPSSRYPDFEKRFAFLNSILEKVRTLPGVVSAGYTSNLPLTTRGNTNGYVLRGQPVGRETIHQDALYRAITVGFMETIGARLREGRFFADSDSATAPPVVIINETMANLHWPGESALGKHVQVSQRGAQYPWLTVVGVVKEIHERGIDFALKPAIYIPHRQGANEWPNPGQMAVRTSVAPASIAETIRQTVWSIDKDQPVSRVRTMETIVEDEVAHRRQSMMLLGLFALLALVLAAIGIYGVLSYLVTQRSREIAIRMALGARPGEVLRWITWRGVTLTVAGLLLGIGGALLSARLLRSLLYGVQEHDARILAAGCMVLALVAVSACLIPARRASQINPATLLRGE